MSKKDLFNKQFLSYGSLDQDDVDKIVEYLKDSGMSKDDIKKAGEYKGWFYLNPNYKEEDKNIKGKK